MPLSENKRMRTSVPARALVAVCTTGAEELSCRGGKLDSIEKKRRMAEKQRLEEAKKALRMALKSNAAEKEKRLKAEAAAAKAEAAAAALVRGDPSDPSLTSAGRAAAAAIDQACDRGEHNSVSKQRFEIRRRGR